jgi:hypothetical protein
VGSPYKAALGETVVRVKAGRVLKAVCDGSERHIERIWVLVSQRPVINAAISIQVFPLLQRADSGGRDYLPGGNLVPAGPKATFATNKTVSATAGITRLVIQCMNLLVCLKWVESPQMWIEMTEA